LQLVDEIYIVGTKIGPYDESMPVAYKYYVNAIEEATGSAMFQSDYSSFDGLSGGAIAFGVSTSVSLVRSEERSGESVFFWITAS
jgi:hypothetical protein